MRDGKPPWKLDIGLEALGTHSGPRAPSLSPPQVPMAPGSAELGTYKDAAQRWSSMRR
jgi:hypothetical protein